MKSDIVEEINMSDIKVRNIVDFKEKYGIQTFTLMVAKFVLNSIDFPGRYDLAGALGAACAELEIALSKVE